MSRVHVDLKERSYDVLIDEGNLASVGELLRKKELLGKVMIVTDPLVNDLYGDTVRTSLKDAGILSVTQEIPRGERFKTLTTAARLYDRMVAAGMQRDSTLIALGGGVVGDTVGFVAATYMRGINLVEVPTTLLAQVDSAVGGKTAVNHPRAKNLIGVFYQPRFVLADVKALITLPGKEFKNGLAEVIKYGVIKDADFFKFLEANVQHLNTRAFEDKDTARAALKVWLTIVTESCKIKAGTVEQDEEEKDLRMILNFGHTIGHAVEVLGGYRKFSHGEAVAIGIAAASRIAEKIKILDKNAVVRIKELLVKVGLPTTITGLSIPKLIRVMEVDKKIRQGKLHFVLPRRIGAVEIRDDVPLRTVTGVLREIGARG